MPPLMPNAEARALLDPAEGAQPPQAEGCEANLQATRGGNIRFARNTVSTSGVTDDATLTVQLAVVELGKSPAPRTSTSSTTRASLARCAARRSWRNLAPEDPEFMPPLEPQQYVRDAARLRATPRRPITPDFRAEAAAQHRRRQGQDLHRRRLPARTGQLERHAEQRGAVRLPPPAPTPTTRLTVRTQRRDRLGLRRRATATTSASSTPRPPHGSRREGGGEPRRRAIEPGKYTVILEPAASVELIQLMLFSMAPARRTRGAASWPSPAAERKLGQKLVDERVTIYSDPADAELPTAAVGLRGPAAQRTTVDREGRGEEPVLHPLLGREAEARGRAAAGQLDHGGRQRVPRGPDPRTDARRAGDAHLVHPRWWTRRPCCSPA